MINIFVGKLGHNPMMQHFLKVTSQLRVVRHVRKKTTVIAIQTKSKKKQINFKVRLSQKTF